MVGGNNAYEETPYLNPAGQPSVRQMQHSYRGEANLVKTVDGYGHVIIKNSVYGPGTAGAISGENFNESLKPYQLVSLMPALFNEGALDPMCSTQDGCAMKTCASSGEKMKPGVSNLYNGPFVAPEKMFPSCGNRLQEGPGGPVVNRSCDSSTARNPNIHFASGCPR